MKRKTTAGLSLFAMAALMASMGWKLANHPESSTGLDGVRVIQSSEYSRPGGTATLAAIRIRLSPNDFDGEIRTTSHQVPQVAVAAE